MSRPGRGRKFLVLPSGRKVRLLLMTDPRRPWEVHEDAGMCVVRRAKRGDSGEYQSFRSASSQIEPLVLTRPDAEALTTALNALAAPGANASGESDDVSVCRVAEPDPSFHRSR